MTTDPEIRKERFTSEPGEMVVATGANRGMAVGEPPPNEIRLSHVGLLLDLSLAEQKKLGDQLAAYPRRGCMWIKKEALNRYLESHALPQIKTI